MARIYGTEEDTGRRYLIRIECDAPSCAAKLSPGQHVRESMWTKCGSDNGPGTDKFEYYYCPQHAR